MSASFSRDFVAAAFSMAIPRLLIEDVRRCWVAPSFARSEFILSMAKSASSMDDCANFFV